jgi:hypothetical protein
VLYVPRDLLLAPVYGEGSTFASFHFWIVAKGRSWNRMRSFLFWLINSNVRTEERK